MRKFTFKSLLITAALCLGTSAWAEDTYTEIYSRVTNPYGSNNMWTSSDIDDWGNANMTISVPSNESDEGTYYGLGRNVLETYSATKTFTAISDNSKIKYEVTWYTGGATGRNSNLNYIQFGDKLRFLWEGKNYQYYLNTVGDNSLSNLVLTASKNYFSKKIVVVFNTATSTIEYCSFDGMDLTETVAGTYEGNFNLVKLGANRGGSGYATSNYLTDITVSECKQILNEANYTIKYLCGDIVVKDQAIRSGVVNNNILLPQSDKEVIWKDGVKYIYVSDDSSDKTITEDGSTVVTVTYREAATYSYTIKSNLGSTIASGSNFEGETITYGYPQYQVSDGTLYSTSKNVNEWRKTFELTEDNQEVTVNYDATSITDVVFHIENENIEGVNVLTANNANIRCSNAAAAWSSSDVVLTTLDKGTYKLVAQVFSPQSSGGNQTFKVGGVTINFITGNSNTTVCESEFMVTDKEDLVWSAGGGNRNGIDFVYVVKLSDELSPVTTAITAAGYATFSSTYAVDFSKAAGLAAYTAKVNDGNQAITLTKIADGIVPANTGVVLKGAAGEYTGTITTTEAVIENNDLVAATKEIASLATETTVDEVTYKNYILNVVDETPGFYQAAGKKVAAGKAYLQVPAETVTGAKTLTIVWNDGETTGIEENYEFGTMNSDAATFDLSGRKVANPAKGLYIKNGKKFIVK